MRLLKRKKKEKRDDANLTTCGSRGSIRPTPLAIGGGPDLRPEQRTRPAFAEQGGGGARVVLAGSGELSERRSVEGGNAARREAGGGLAAAAAAGPSEGVDGGGGIGVGGGGDAGGDEPGAERWGDGVGRHCRSEKGPRYSEM